VLRLGGAADRAELPPSPTVPRRRRPQCRRIFKGVSLTLVAGRKRG